MWKKNRSNPDEKLEALYELGLKCYDHGNLRDAVKIFYDMTDVVVSCNKWYALANTMLGHCHTLLQDYPKASLHLDFALNTAMRLEHQSLLAMIYNHFSIYFLEIGLVEPAERMIQSAYDINRELERHHAMAMNYGNLGHICLMKKDYAGAFEIFKKALQKSDESQWHASRSVHLSNLGLWYAMTNEIDIAIKYYQMSLKIDLEYDHRLGKIEDYIHLGMLYQSKHDYWQAKVYFDAALEIAKELRLVNKINLIREILKGQ